MNTAYDPLGLINFRCHLDDKRIAWLTLDCVASPINRLSTDVRQELGQALDYFDHARPTGLIIRSAKTTGFIAGADIDEFAALDTTEKAMALVASGWHLFNRLAAVPYPTLALIHGHCLGGGLELALACRYRLVLDQTGTSLALPEVKLGIFPGWGGMHRLPRLIGAPAALDMLLTGRAMNARRAAKLGLADGCVPLRLLDQAAQNLVISGKPTRTASGLPGLLNLRLLRGLSARLAAKKLDQRDPQQHYPAPRAILDIWSQHDGNAMQTPELVDQIIRSETARNLLRVFRLQERLKALGKADNPTPPVQHVHVIGAGIMGGDIAAWCVLQGLTVTLQDRDRTLIAHAQGKAQQLFKRRNQNPRLARAAADRLIPDPHGHGIRRADIIIEAITENADLKRTLYAQIQPHMKPGALLATNTSSLSLEELRTGLNAPQRFVGIHFFNPVAKMPLVEVVHTQDTCPQARQAACAFVGQIGKLALPVLSTPGFLVNAVLAPYMLEAMRCVDEGMQFETIDAAMLAFGMPMGPIELIDTVGLDIVRDAGAQLLSGAAMPHCLESRLARHHLGKKTSHGFYHWKDQRPVRQKVGHIPAALAERLIRPLIAMAQTQVDNGVVVDADLADAGIIFGTGYAPYTGGPLYHQRQISTAASLAQPDAMMNNSL
ncbi:MAG: enoyl-CoA hydratase/isomerase family protein [Burkholderiaceae bacterium]|nr:enoyl-CoA hydratase/isomerase family protein [Burkholderiaceae bacterium]